MSRRLRVGDRVCFVREDGSLDRDDLGVVAQVVRGEPATCERVCVIVWDDGHVDEVTPRGRPRCRAWSSGIAVRRTGARWSRARAKVQLTRALDELLDDPVGRESLPRVRRG